MSLKSNLELAAKTIQAKKKGIAFTGAGISTASGIPDFRSENGIWKQFDIYEYGYLSGFIKNPEKIWHFIHTIENNFSETMPNAGHAALSELEKLGYIDSLITQNIDSLHQKAGTQNILELHGSLTRLLCLSCGTQYARNDASLELKNKIPYCFCKKVLKPTLVFFGEPLPSAVFDESIKKALKAGFVIIAGTSGSVYPAAQIPFLAKRNGAAIIEINSEKTQLTQSVTDIFLEGKTEDILPQLSHLLK